MTPADIKNLVTSTFQSLMASAQYQLSRIPYHTHNGKDSPFTYQPYIVYAGYLNANATLSRNKPFPSGWKIGHPTTGQYNIEHDIGNTFYTVIPTQVWESTTNPPPAVVFVSAIAKNTVQINWFNSATAAPLDTSFYLTVVSVANSKNSPPLYNTTQTS